MIYTATNEPSEAEFLALLERTKLELLKVLQTQAAQTPTQFEELVCSTMTACAEDTAFAGTIRQTNTASFPDIVVQQYYGVEVKMTIKDHWRSTGNSVLESLREPGVERIYILFGKLGGVPDVRCRLYQECLPEVSVTHSPRYRIDMNLAPGQSIFDKIGTPYNELRSNGDTIAHIKNYYRKLLKPGEGLWWIDEETESASPIIKQYRTLSDEDKERFKVECLVLFPELFKSRAEYERTAAYLITNFGAVSASLRDVFSAGGKVDIAIAGETVSVPHLQAELFAHATQVQDCLQTLEDETLAYYWGVEAVAEDRLQQWQQLIDVGAAGDNDAVLPSAVFRAGVSL